MRIGKDAPFLGEREIISRNPLKYAPVYTWITYGQADTRRRHIGSALHSLFQKVELGAGEYPTVGIWSQNRPGMHVLFMLSPNTDSSDSEWQLIDIAVASYQMVSVSLYDTLSDDSVGEWKTEYFQCKNLTCYQNICKIISMFNRQVDTQTVKNAALTMRISLWCSLPLTTFPSC